MVQMTISRILNALYEPLLLECSYGFRCGRSCHQALNVLDKAIMSDPVNYVIDADIRGFFDNVDHKWLMRMLQEKIVNRNFLRIIGRFLKAGVMEDGERKKSMDLPHFWCIWLDIHSRNRGLSTTSTHSTAAEVSIGKEPDVGIPQVRFREGLVSLVTVSQMFGNQVRMVRRPQSIAISLDIEADRPVGFSP